MGRGFFDGLVWRNLGAAREAEVFGEVATGGGARVFRGSDRLDWSAEAEFGSAKWWREESLEDVFHGYGSRHMSEKVVSADHCVERGSEPIWKHRNLKRERFRRSWTRTRPNDGTRK